MNVNDLPDWMKKNNTPGQLNKFSKTGKSGVMDTVGYEVGEYGLIALIGAEATVVAFGVTEDVVYAVEDDLLLNNPTTETRVFKLLK